MPVRVQTEDFDTSREIEALRLGDGGVGAIACFVGTVRERSEGSAVSRMELEHYPGMTEKAIEAMIDEVIVANPKQVAQYVGGKKTVAAFFIGNVMRLSKGQANPTLLNELVTKKLDAIASSS